MAGGIPPSGGVLIDKNTVGKNQSGELQVITDGSSIIEQANGLQVAPGTVILGDFENDTMGSWTGNGMGYISPAEGGADGTAVYLEAYNDVTGTDSANRSYNFDNVSELTVHLAIGNRTNYAGTSDDVVKCEIGGSTVASLNGGSTVSWQEFVVDTSNISGSQEIRVATVNNSGTGFEGDADRIIAKEQNIPSTTSDGAGGTA